jgi:uncharacterized protein (UPF0332 family)
MSFDWVKYLTLAQELAALSEGHTNREALRRSVISRAYYAAFCQARNYLRAVDKDQALVDHSPHVHQSVIDRFEGSDDTTKQNIGSALDRLRKIRNIADYQDSFRNLERKALKSLQYAEAVIEDLEKLRF